MTVFYARLVVTHQYYSYDYCIPTRKNITSVCLLLLKLFDKKKLNANLILIIRKNSITLICLFYKLKRVKCREQSSFCGCAKRLSIARCVDCADDDVCIGR